MAVKARMKIERAETSLEDTQMLQAPMIATASADPKVTILRNHSILSDLFITPKSLFLQCKTGDLNMPSVGRTVQKASS